MYYTMKDSTGPYAQERWIKWAIIADLLHGGV